MMENEMMASGGGKSAGSSIAERRAATCGFKLTPRLSTARFRSSGHSPLSSPAAVVIRSPFVTIPPGISPSTLLDSPVMLLNSQAPPSPTTGSFQLPFVEYETMSHAVENANAGRDNHFMSRNQPIAPSSISILQKTNINQHFPYLNHKEKQQIESGDNGSTCKEECSTKQMQQNRVVSTASLHSESKQTHHPNKSSIGEDDVTPQQQQLFEENELAGFTSSVGRQSEDRHNWQKYGRQKHVECTEFPLSFHHQKPPPHPPTNGSAFLYSNSIDKFSEVGPLVSFDEESIGKNLHQGGPQDEISVNWKVEGSLDWASSASVITTELSDAPPSSTAQEKCSSIQQGCTMIVIDGEDDDDDDKSESKRRKGESSMIDTSATPSSVREPRVVVQTISEIDILEDGYRWKKYGQKVVKGNPNPRSYYKCTHPGCSVRKLVERASYDLKSVITTYEGKHNHAVPAGKSQKPAATAAAAATVQLDRGPEMFCGCQEIYELLNCRARRKNPHAGGFSALEFGSLSSSVPFPVSNLEQNLACQAPASFLEGDIGFGNYAHYDQARASVGEVVEFLHGQQKSMEEDDMSFFMLPMEEQGNMDFDSYTG